MILHSIPLEFSTEDNPRLARDVQVVMGGAESKSRPLTSADLENAYMTQTLPAIAVFLAGRSVRGS